MEVIDVLRTYDFYPVNASQVGTSTHAKHIIRLRHLRDIATPKEEAYEIILINSHNGTVRFQLRFGIFRLVCTNGLIIGISLCQPVTFKHLRTYGAMIKAAVNTFNMEVGRIEEAVNRMKNTTIGAATATGLAMSGINARWGSYNDSPEKVSAIRLTHPRREEDISDSLWCVYNRIQENLIKGQVENSVRPLTDAFKCISVNEALWNKAYALVA